MKIQDLLCETVTETLQKVYPTPSTSPVSICKLIPKVVEKVGIEPKKFPCPFENCNKSFTRKYNLSAHLRCHNQEKPFECIVCPMKFARKHDLQRHIRSLHEQKKQYGPCEYCNAYFTRSDALARHLRIEKERRFLTRQPLP
jgi:hypothetical protein